MKLGLAAENKHKKVFSIMTIMVKAHNKSRSELSAMKVAELKTLIRKHNLDNAIRGYSAMRKADLVDALVKHSTGEKAAAKPAAKPAAKKRKLEIVKEGVSSEDDFFANIGKGKRAIPKAAPLKKVRALPNTLPRKCPFKEFDDQKKADRLKAAAAKICKTKK